MILREELKRLQTKICLQWYCLPKVKFAMRNHTYQHEFAMLTPKCYKDLHPKSNIRNLTFNLVKHLDFHMKNLNFKQDNKIYNLYLSVAKYKNGIPLFSGNLSTRNTKDWNENHWKKIEDYQLFIDIDAPDFEYMHHAKRVMLNMKSYFDSLPIKYYIYFSGCGFHFIIQNDLQKDKDSKIIYDPDSDKNIYKFYKIIAKKLSRKFGDFPDLTIYDSRRLRKVPYSLSVYNPLIDKPRIYVVSPLETDEECTKFLIDNYTPITWKGKFHQKPIPPFNDPCRNSSFNNLLEDLKLKW